MWKKLKKLFSSYAFNIALIIAIAALVLYLTLKNNPTDLVAMIRSASVGWLLVIALIVVTIRVLNGWTIKMETNLTNPGYTLSQGIVNSFVGGFFNEITPSASGGQFAQVYIFRRQGIPVSSSAGILWLDFIVYQSTMVASVFLLILLRFHTFYSNYSQFFLIVLLGFVVNSAVIVSLWALVRFPRFYTWLSTKGVELASKWKLIKDPQKAKDSLSKQLERFGKEVEVIRQNRQMIWKVVLGHFLRLMLYYSIPFFCALALHIEVTPSKLIDILALSAFVSMVNAFIPLPGSSGGTEATFLLMFSTIFPRSQASIIMILWRFSSYYFDMILGGLTFIYAKNRAEIPLQSVDELDQ